MVIYSKNEEGQVFIHAIQVNESGLSLEGCIFCFCSTSLESESLDNFLKLWKWMMKSYICS
jgi:hypothetical protein